MSTSLKDPNAAENDAQGKLEDPYRHRSLPSSGDADNPYANPQDIKRDIGDRPTIGNAERNARPHSPHVPINQQEGAGSINYTGSGKKYPQKKPSATWLRKKGVWMLVVATLASGAIVWNTFITPAMGLINLKEVMVDKFSSRMEALLERRSGRIIAKKLGGKNFTTAGCVVKVKCRYKGMSNREIRKFQSRNPGWEIEYEKRPGLLKNKVIGLKGPNGVLYPPDEFLNQVKNSSDLRKSLRNFHKGKVAFWTGKVASNLYTKWKVFRGKTTKQAAQEGEGKTPEEKQKIRTRDRIRTAVAGKVEALGIRPSQASNPEDPLDAQQTIEENKKAVDVTDGADEAALDRAEQAEDMTKPVDPIDNANSGAVRSTANAIKEAANPKELLRGFLLGPLATPTAICTTKNMLNGIGYAAKALGQIQLIRYAMVFVTTADMTKSGDATSLIESQQVSDLMHMLNTKDPENGNSYTDSFGYQYAAYDKISTVKGGNEIDTEQFYKYIIGGGATGRLLGTMHDIDKVVGDDFCNFVLNPFVQVGGAAVSIVANIFSGGTVGIGSLAARGAAGAGVAYGLSVAMKTITPMLAGLLSGTLVTGDENGQDGGNAITSGFGAAASQNMRSHAMAPLSKDQVLKYDAELAPTVAQIRKDEGGNPLDINNPQSFTSKMGVALLPALSNLSFAKLPTSLSSISTTALSSFGNKTLGAASDALQYDICKDADYEELNIAADPFCNPQYGFDPSQISADEDSPYDSEKVADYMYENEFVNDNGDPQGEYESFISDCINNTEPLNSMEGNGAVTPDLCLNPDKTSDSAKYTKFRLYYLDSVILADMEDEPVGEEVETSSGSLLSGDAQELAQQVLSGGNVTFLSYREQVEAIANGQEGLLDPDLIRLMATMAQNHKFSITSLNRCPGQGGSQHCAGKAMDIGVIDGQSISYDGQNPKIQKFLSDAAAVMKAPCEIGVPNQGYVDATSKNSKCSVFIDIGSGPHVHLAVGD